MANKTIVELPTLATVPLPAQTFVPVDDGTQTFKFPLERLAGSRAIYTNDDTWVAPSGVTSVRVTPIRTTPQIADLTKFGTIPAVNPDSLGLSDPSGRTYVWGNNLQGQYGLGTTVASPSAVFAYPGFRYMTNGGTTGKSNIGLTLQGQLFSAGLNNFGQLGVGDVVMRSTPTLVVGGQTWDFVTQNSNGGAYAITRSGALYAWGQNTAAVPLGFGDIIPRSIPTLLSSGVSFSQIKIAHPANTLALSTSGQAYAWGPNTYGQLGTNDVLSRSTPTLVAGGVTFTNVFPTPGLSFFATQANGNMYGWGYNNTGALGLGDNLARSTPTLIAGGSIKFISASTGYSGATIALATNGSIYGMGFNLQGELGLGDTISRSTPTLITANVSGIKFISAEINYNGAVFALASNGKLYTWGNNAQGVLGLGDTVNRSTPTVVGPNSNLSFQSAIAIPGGTALAMANNGHLYSWGATTVNPSGAASTTPTFVPAYNPNTVPSYSPVIIPVTPGVSYPVSIKGPSVYFGDTYLGAGPANQLAIEFFQ